MEVSIGQCYDRPLAGRYTITRLMATERAGWRGRCHSPWLGHPRLVRSQASHAGRHDFVQRQAPNLSSSWLRISLPAICFSTMRNKPFPPDVLSSKRPTGAFRWYRPRRHPPEARLCIQRSSIDRRSAGRPDTCRRGRSTHSRTRPRHALRGEQVSLIGPFPFRQTRGRDGILDLRAKMNLARISSRPDAQWRLTAMGRRNRVPPFQIICVHLRSSVFPSLRSNWHSPRRLRHILKHR